MNSMSPTLENPVVNSPSAAILGPRLQLGFSLRERRDCNPKGWSGKRLFDFAIVLAAAPFALVVIAFAGLAIALTDGRPIFFIQERIGRHGYRFRMFKLRTMGTAGRKEMAAEINDSRVTAVGRVLRKYRIDELPQLANILFGHMSLIGPRPEQPDLVAQYRRAIPSFDERHLVKPGITGLAQVCYGYAGNLKETRSKVRYDRLYVRNCSFFLDLMIAAKTVQTVLRNEGAR